MNMKQIVEFFFDPEQYNILEYNYLGCRGIVVKVETLDGEVEIHEINVNLKGLAESLNTGNFNVAVIGESN